MTKPLTAGTAAIRSPSNQATNLSVREHFAALALQGLCSSYKPPCGVHDAMAHVSLARNAVALADALIAELNKEKSE